MALPLTPEMLRAAYDFLCTTPPFRSWNLPDGDSIRFKVGRDPTLRGWHNSWREGRRMRHELIVSSRCIGHTTNLMATLAHEMIHLHIAHSRVCKNCAEHGPAFMKYAEQVCKFHGFDPKLF